MEAPPDDATPDDSPPGDALPEDAPAEDPPTTEVEPEEEEEPKKEKLRHVNPGIGLGIAHLGATGPYVSRTGLALDFRSESGIHELMQFNFSFRTSVIYPERTLAVGKAAVDVGAWTTRAFGDLYDWTQDGSKGPPPPFKGIGAFFGFFGLTMAYTAVPVLFVVSPFASLGETTIGPTFSIHSAKETPNLWFEAGMGVSMFGHPADAFGIGYGPLLGTGVQLEKITIGTHWLVSPAGWHSDSADYGGTYLSGALVVGL